MPEETATAPKPAKEKDKDVMKMDGVNNEVIYRDGTKGKIDDIKSDKAKDQDKALAEKAKKFKNVKK